LLVAVKAVGKIRALLELFCMLAYTIMITVVVKLGYRDGA